MNYRVKLEAFEGPLDLLLKLIERQELPVALISVREIVEQFFEYFARAEFADFEEAGQFLVLAATLLAIKAQLVLPCREEEMEIDSSFFPQEEAEAGGPGHDLLTYQQVREVAVTLEACARNWQLCHKRPPFLFQQRPAPQAAREDLLRLIQALKEILARKPPLFEPYEVKPVPVDLGERMEYILNQLQLKPGGLLFSELFSPPAPREEIIVTFLALLELVYQRRVKVNQSDGRGEIVLTPAGSEKTLGRDEDAGHFS